MNHADMHTINFLFVCFVPELRHTVVRKRKLEEILGKSKSSNCRFRLSFSLILHILNNGTVLKIFYCLTTTYMADLLKYKE